MLDPTKSTRSKMPRRVFALAAVAAITLAACGDDDDDTPAAAATTQAIAPAATTAAPAPTTAGGKGDYDYGSSGSATTAAPASGAAGAVMVADTGLGKVLTGSNGMTLYLFMPDAQGDPTCTADCAKAWPALSASGSPTGGDGVDASLLGTATNPDSGPQVTYNGWPLYYFSGDSAPGDTNGQGQGGIWYAVDPTGNAIDND